MRNLNNFGVLQEEVEVRAKIHFNDMLFWNFESVDRRKLKGNKREGFYG